VWEWAVGWIYTDIVCGTKMPNIAAMIDLVLGSLDNIAKIGTISVASTKEGATTLSMKTFIIKTFIELGLNEALSINDTRHNVMLNVTFLSLC
jgi:hypothetical protein